MQFTQSKMPSTVPDEELTTYRWLPPTYDAAVFVVHGFRAHARFNFLRHDSPTSLSNYGDETCSSLIRELNTRSLAVFAHDHVGHGNSTGLRAYFPAFSSLVDDLLAYVHSVDKELRLRERGVPIFLLGHSMGGTVCILAARDNPKVFSGMALSSAASEPPASMFGFKGHVQYWLSGITSRLCPKAELLALPPAPDPMMRAIFDADDLTCKNNVRARVGREFLDAYSNIAGNVSQVRLPFLTVSGELDTLVNPEAAERFYNRAGSKDKMIFKGPGRWHSLLAEEGKEEMWTLFADWIRERAGKKGRDTNK